MRQIEAAWVRRLPDLQLDRVLAPRSLEPVVKSTAKLLAASPDLATVVVTDTRRVIIMAVGRAVPVEIAAADSATLLAGGRLLVTAPTLERLGVAVLG